jgi:hypothetical protein
MSDAVDPAAPPPTAPPASSIPSWSSFDADARFVIGAALAAVGIIIVGGLVGAWPSTVFVLVALVGAVIAAAATWMGAATPASLARVVPSPIVASLAASVVAVLAVLRFVELLFDLDQLDEVGGVAGAATIVLLAIAGGALLGAAHRRDRATYDAIRSNDTSAQLALFGLLLVVLGWAVNLSSYWTMVQATLSLTVLTLAALLIVLAGRGLPPAATWAGLLLAGVGALLAVDQWGQLSRLGETRLELGLTDYLPFLVYVIGLVLIIAAGVRRLVVRDTGVGQPVTQPADESPHPGLPPTGGSPGDTPGG